MRQPDSATRSSPTDSRYFLAQTIARHAGMMALEFFRRRDQLIIEFKGTQDMVSAADRDVESYIKAQVRAVFADDGFLGEEGGVDNTEAEFVWVVDPIDGTACFVNGMHSWCVSIAVLHRGEPVIGVVFDPNTNELFHARTGGGAFCGAQPIRVTRAPDGEPSPYVLVRVNLEARIHRNVFYQLVGLGVVEPVDGRSWLGVWSAGQFFPIGPLPG